ncbi:hypothetical protein WA588_005650 [Blastocystis sp. NMH]
MNQEKTFVPNPKTQERAQRMQMGAPAQTGYRAFDYGSPRNRFDDRVFERFLNDHTRGIIERMGRYSNVVKCPEVREERIKTNPTPFSTLLEQAERKFDAQKQ